MSAATRVAFLSRVLHGTVNSVVQYIEISTPYVPPDCREHLATVRKIRDEQAHQAHELTALIQGMDSVPSVGAFPYWNIDLNYLDLRFMAGFAARHEAGVIAEMEGGLDQLRQDGLAYSAVRRMLLAKRDHLALLEAIAKKPEKPRPAAAPTAKPAAAATAKPAAGATPPAKPAQGGGAASAAPGPGA
ncbi:MAG: hypothetical protein ACT4PV_11355 [Planctomycetaceae bacterium]